MLENIDFVLKSGNDAYSWEANELPENNVRFFNASECSSLPFPPELTVEPILPDRDRITARVVKSETDLVMDFAFLLCGWESRSVAFDNGFKLRHNLSLPGVTHDIISQVAENLSKTAEEILMLESACGLGIKRDGAICAALCRAIMDIVRLHRTLVLKLGTVKSLTLFVKLTRRCCGGIEFITKLFKGVDSSQGDVHLLLSLLAFSPYAHGDFEKKLLAFLLKSCTKPYVEFIGKIMRGVIVKEQVENFTGTELSVHRDIQAATGGISGILLDLHSSVVQCIRNGKILHSPIMKESILENIERNRVLNKMEKKIFSGHEKPVRQIQRVIGTMTKPKPFDHRPPPALETGARRELTEDPNCQKISASLGVELEHFYKELQSRIKSQYDLENWKQRRTQMALKRLGHNVQLSPQVLEKEEPKPSSLITKAEPETGPTLAEGKVNVEKSDRESDAEPVKKKLTYGAPPIKAVKPEVILKNPNEKHQLEKSRALDLKLPITTEASSTVTKNQQRKKDKSELDSLVDSSIIGAPKDPERDFLLMVLPLKSELGKLNAQGLRVILAGMRFFEKIDVVKKLLFFQNRSFLERICQVVNEPIGAGWRISSVVDLVSNNYNLDSQILKNVTFKPYLSGVSTNLSLSYNVDWPLDLIVTPDIVNLIESASSFLLEIELVKWKLNQLYKSLLTARQDNYPVKLHFMLHEYVLFTSRLSSYAYSQVHDECWPVFDKRLESAVFLGKTIEGCQKVTLQLFRNITSRLFLEKRAAKIHEIFIAIVKNSSDFVAIVRSMKNDVDQVAISKAFRKFHDFQSLKKHHIKTLRLINSTGSQWFDDLIS